jgi:hypothetical protein
MHLVSLNLTDLLLGLWRGSLDVDSTSDDKETWHWAVLKGDIWKEHGKRVAAATTYLPSSFDRPPRNPAEKISSGYKAWEFLTYVYGYGPGFFYHILPQVWQQNQDSSFFEARPLITERPAVSAENPVTQSDGSPKKFPPLSAASLNQA